MLTRHLRARRRRRPRRSPSPQASVTATFTPQQLWWIQFILTLVFGFASILGVAVPGMSANKLTKFITNNPYVFDVIDIFAPGVSITPQIIFNILNGLWRANFLMPMLMLIAVELSWWALGRLAIYLSSLFAPGVNQIVVASMLVNFTIMAIRLSLLAVDYPTS